MHKSGVFETIMGVAMVTGIARVILQSIELLRNKGGQSAKTWACNRRCLGAKSFGGRGFGTRRRHDREWVSAKAASILAR
jgi:hypothetical protein